MEFDHSFSVAAPIDAAWAAMTDIEPVASCVPNARVTGPAGAGSYDVEVTFAVGPLETVAQRGITLASDDATDHEVLTVLVTDAWVLGGYRIAATRFSEQPGWAWPGSAP